MTPKEKAQELVDSFMSIKNIKLSDYSVIYLPTAKQCALIAVNEILKSIDNFEIQDFYLKVKQEIAKL